MTTLKSSVVTLPMTYITFVKGAEEASFTVSDLSGKVVRTDNVCEIYLYTPAVNVIGILERAGWKETERINK